MLDRSIDRQVQAASMAIVSSWEAGLGYPINDLKFNCDIK